MAENVLKLKKQAVTLGMSKDDAKKASRPVLEAFIAGASKSDESDDGPAKVTKKKNVAKKKTSENTESKKKTTTKKKPGRPAGTKKTTTKPKAKSKAKPKNDENGDSGRLSIGTLDWGAESDEWNPRKGSAVEVLFKALKSSKGNVEKAFDKVVGNIGDFVGAKKRDGTKRSKAEREKMLRYRLNRTKFDFAVKTGQHEVATNRSTYGEGAYATTHKKKKTRATSERKPNRKASSTTSTKKGGKKRTTKKK